MTGVSKPIYQPQFINGLKSNVRPSTTMGMLKRLDRIARDRDQTVKSIQKFLEDLKSLNKARIVRDGNEQFIYGDSTIYKVEALIVAKKLMNSNMISQEMIG